MLPYKMEGVGLFHICALLAFLIFTKTQASVIKFAAYPSELKANLTSSTSMRCSLADTDVNGGHIRKRSVTSTTDDILHISAIYITRNNGDDVASVSPFDAPIAYVEFGNLEVKGDVSGTASEGFLELSWKDASAMALGEYVCEISTVTDHHHTVLFTTTLEMTEVQPTINDVITELKNLKRQQTTEATEIEHLKHQQTVLKECTSRRFGFMAVISKFNGAVKTVTHGQPVVFDKVIYTVGGNYDNTTGQFICTEPGIYSFSVHSLSNVNSDISLNLKLNSDIITSAYSWGPRSTVETGSTSALLHLKINDTVQVMSSNGHDSTFYQDSSNFQGNVFIGNLVQSDCVV